LPSWHQLQDAASEKYQNPPEVRFYAFENVARLLARRVDSSYLISKKARSVRTCSGMPA
jgi:hypothetical protein